MELDEVLIAEEEFPASRIPHRVCAAWAREERLPRSCGPRGSGTQLSEDQLLAGLMSFLLTARATVLFREASS